MHDVAPSGGFLELERTGERGDGREPGYAGLGRGYSGLGRRCARNRRDCDAHAVAIAGDFNGWVPDKGVRSLIESEGPERVWTKILTLPPGTYEYRYIVDGEWREDPENPQRVPSALGGRNSILVVR